MPSYFFEKNFFNHFQNKSVIASPEISGRSNLKKRFLANARNDIPETKIALFLDFDGTLVPIQKDPAKCFLSEKTKEQLQLLANSTHCYVSILSGRLLSDIRKRVGIRKIYYGGNHGLNISGPDVKYIHPKALSARPVIRDIKHMLQKEIADIEGAWLEDKKFTLSLHFRSVKKNNIPLVKKVFYKTVAGFLEKTPMRPRLANRYEKSPLTPLFQRGELFPSIKRGVGVCFPPFAKGGEGGFSEEKLLTVIKGKKVLELVPYVSWDKGCAALWILKRLKNKYLPIYIGDDQTDETAFKALSKEGITIRVGKSKKTSANFYLKGYWEVSRFLFQIQRFAKSLVKNYRKES